MTADAERSRSPSERVAAAIREARERTGQTPDALAARAGIDPAAYGAIERGEGDVPLDALVGIGAALEMTVAELFAQAHV